MEQEAWKKSSKSGGWSGISLGHGGGRVAWFERAHKAPSAQILFSATSEPSLGMLSSLEQRFNKLSMGKLSQLEVTQHSSAPKLQTLLKLKCIFYLVKPNLWGLLPLSQIQILAMTVLPFHWLSNWFIGTNQEPSQMCKVSLQDCHFPSGSALPLQGLQAPSPRLYPTTFLTLPSPLMPHCWRENCYNQLKEGLF